MTDRIPVKAIYTGSDVTSLGELASGDTINASYISNLPAGLPATGVIAGDVLYYDGSNWVRLAKGTATQVLTVNSGATAPEWAAASGAPGPPGPSGGLVSMSWYAPTTVSNFVPQGATYTWTKPAGITMVKAYATGGGGATSNGTGSDQSTGGAGGTAISLVDVSAISTVTVTIGAGGSSGTSANQGVNGTNGSTSSFGSFATGNGGQGGFTNSGGLGGSASGDVALIGGGGAGALTGGGNGSDSFWGGGGMGFGPGAGYASTHRGYVGGSGGACSTPNHWTWGGNGVVLVEEYA